MTASPSSSSLGVSRRREILINGRFLCQRATGVQRVSREFTVAADRLLAEGAFPGLGMRLVAPVGADFASLGLCCITTEHLGGGTGYYWEQVALPRRARAAQLLCLGNSAPLLPMLQGKRVAVMLHDQAYRLFPDDYTLPYRIVHAIVERLILHRARPLFTVSETERAAIRATNPGIPLKIVVAANGAWINDDEISAPPSKALRTGGFGLYVGGFSARKNFERVFQAALELAARGVPFRFVGEPNARSEALLAAATDEARRLIRFTGYVDNDALAALYRDAAFLLYPSLYEASGLPPSEAMTFGCPVIVSDLPVMHERCGGAALFCDPHDWRTFVAAALRIVDDPDVAVDLSRRGRAWVQQFSWRNQAIAIIEAMEADPRQVGT